MNKYAKFVVRALQFGSEPLFDDVLRVNELAQQVREAKARIMSLHIPVTVSDLAYSYQKVSDVKGALPLVFILVSSEWRSTPHYLRNWHDRCACVTLLRAGCVDRFVSNKYIQGLFICKFVLVILFTARNAWPFVQKDVDWFAGNGQGKKIYLSQVRVIMVHLN